jgi:hypothetical protein
MSKLGRVLVGAFVVTAALGVTATAAAAAGPPEEVFAGQEDPWFCHEDSGGTLPEHHCLNVSSQGNTVVLLVFEPDPRGPQESGSSDPEADLRPCPHDPDADPDGTWWEVLPGFFVCHHRP